MRCSFLAVLILSAAVATPARAGEIFAGVMAHDVNTPLTRDIGEHGVDFELGWRGDRIGWLRFIGKPQPHLLASINSDGDTSFVAAGVSWRLGKGPFYARPGIGVAVHTGPSLRVGSNGFRTDLGSRILFEPEFSVGVKVTPRVSVEASWVHLSHAQLFSRQNPGLDTIGTRVALRF